MSDAAPNLSRPSSSAPVRGRQENGARMQWRLDGAGAPGDPLVVCLHGYGMDEDLFAVLLQKLFTLPVRFVLPRATLRADAGLRALHGASWYDYDADRARFHRELLRVEGEIVDLVADVERTRELRPSSRFLLGFSQGGYCGAWVALRRADLFHGMIISGARVKTEFLQAEMREAGARGFRALLCHGDRDRSVSPDAAQRSRDALADAGVAVELRTFAAGHSLGREQIEAISEWMQRFIVDKAG